MALGMLWALNILLAGISSSLLAILLVIYGKNAAHVRSRFAIGLLCWRSTGMEAAPGK